MQLIANEGELEKIKARKRGYLVNVWPGNVVIVHNLAHLCYPSEHQLKYSPRAPTYYAQTRQEVNNHPSPWGQEKVEDCRLCDRKEVKEIDYS